MPETDGQLVRRALAGDGSAFAELERRYRASVERMAGRLMDSPEDAEDMAQDALLRAMLLYCDVFHVLLYLYELDGPDRGGYLVARRMPEWTAIRDRFERRVEELSERLAPG